MFDRVHDLVRQKVISQSSQGYTVVCVGECSECMRLSTEKLPRSDGSGRPIIILTSSKDAFRRISHELRKPVLLDTNNSLSAKIKAVHFPRQYRIGADFRVLSAQTGRREEDSRNGFQEL